MYRLEDTAYIAHAKTASMSVARVMEQHRPGSEPYKQAVAWNWKGEVWQKSSPHHELDFPMPTSVISVIREPEDWYTSWFFHVKDRTESFDDWFPQFVRTDSYSLVGFIGLKYTTHLIFFEKLAEGWDAVMDDLGLPRFELPYINRKRRHDRLASDFFTDAHRKLLDSDMVSTYLDLKKRLGDESFLNMVQ